MSPCACAAPAEAVAGLVSGGASETGGLHPLGSAATAARELRRLILAATLHVGVLVMLPGGLTGTLVAAPLGHGIARARSRQSR